MSCNSIQGSLIVKCPSTPTPIITIFGSNLADITVFGTPASPCALIEPPPPDDACETCCVFDSTVYGTYCHLDPSAAISQSKTILGATNTGGTTPQRLTIMFDVPEITQLTSIGCSNSATTNLDNCPIGGNFVITVTGNNFGSAVLYNTQVAR